MLIYNYKKEFLGIDESDLEALGLSDLASLRAEAADFADLFVKTPGHIHNFKHVHWIDYITCNEAGVSPKAVIHVKGRNYTTNIDIRTIYLVDNPSEKAFAVYLSNIRPLSQSQSDQISSDVVGRAAPAAATEPAEIFAAPSAPVQEERLEATFDPYEADVEPQSPNIIEDIYESTPTVDDFASDEPLDIDLGPEETELEEYIQESIEPEVQKTIEPSIATEKIEEVIIDENDPFANYVFNPQLASEELGLPIDLVEEFIQDFISQANSFKEDLYDSASTGDLDNVKIQSHKLKGVAANLRVEDALDALTIINTSENPAEIKTNLDRLYRIIHKLSNPGSSAAEIQETSQEVDEDEFVLSIKEDEPTVTEDVKVESEEPEPVAVEKADVIDFAQDIAESEIEIDDALVPDSLNLVQLEDDEFLKQNVVENSVSDEDLAILDTPIDEPDEDIQTEAMEIDIPYDKKLVAKEIGIDIESFNELFNDYINESQELTASIENSIAKDDLSACRSSAIKLKGMSENMRIHKFDNELETIINSSSTDGLNDSIESIVSKLGQISEAGDK